jgi:capsular exopolysaccharide synthesis family protein
VELKDYWRTIRRRSRIIVACVLVTLAAAAVITWQMTPQYSSSARLFVSTSQTDEASAYQGGLFATQRVASYADLVTGQRLADAVADDLGGDVDPETLTGRVTAQVVPETVILEITATDPDPQTAQDLAQAYAEELSDLVGQLETPEGQDEAVITASIVDDARFPESPVSPQPVRNLGLAAVLGLLLGLGAAVVRELLDTSVKSNEDVAEVTAAPLVGHIFADAVAAREAPGPALRSATPWAEAFRVLRTNMQYVQVDNDSSKVVVVSSSVPGEGKTTTAINLAVSLSMSNQRVALVECDLRRPLIADRLGLAGEVGTTTVLVGRIGLDEALQDYRGTDLKVLTSGGIPPNPAELLQSHAMERLVADLRARFDVVVVDAPPLLPVTDAALLAARVDGAMVVVRHGHTTRDQLAHAVDRLESVDARTLGVVMNLTPAKKAASAYGYGYGYGYAPDPRAARSTAAEAAGSPAGQRRAGKRSRRPVS